MRWVLWLVAVAAVAAGGWLVLGEHGAEPGPDDPVERGGAQPDRHAPALAGALDGARAERTAAPPGRGGIEGRALEAGRPAPGAEVELRFLAGAPALAPQRSPSLRAWFRLPEPPGPVVARAVADADGSFRFPGLGAGVYGLQARRGTARAVALTGLVADGARVSVTLELVAGQLALAGRVRFADGRPAAGTLVLSPYAAQGRATPWRASEVEPPGTTACALAADGSFRAEGLLAGELAVKLVGEGFAALGPNARLPATAPYEWVLVAGSSTLTGRVVDAATEAPVPGATVLAGSSAGRQGGPWALCVADGDGRFTATGLAPPPYVSAEAEGYAPVTRTFEAATTEATLRLVRLTRVRGVVRSVEGAPAAGAIVTCLPLGAQRGASAGARVTADADGRYTLDLSPGPTMVYVRGGGWVSVGLLDARTDGYNPLAVDVPAGGLAGHDLVALRALRLQGRVRDAGGGAVAGAVVRPSVRWQGNGVDFRVAGALVSDVAVSDAAGEYAFEGLAAGQVLHLMAEAPGQPPLLSGPHAAPPGGAFTVDLTFAPARWVEVQVLTEDDGRPLPEATLTLSTRGAGQGEGWSQTSTTATTDADGRARLGPAGAGELGVRARHPLLRLEEQPTVVEGSRDGAGPLRLTLRLPRGRSVSGRVLDAQGQPSFAQVVARPAGGGPRLSSSATTDADGRFTLPGLPLDPVNLLATRWLDGGTQTAEATAGVGAGEVTLTLTAGEEAPRLLVRVLDDRGRPVPQATATLVSQGGSSSVGVADGLARFTVDARPGSMMAQGYATKSLHLHVSGARGDDGSLLGLAPARVGPLTEDQRELEVRLAPGRTVSGRVRTDGGAPVAGVLVRVSSEADATAARHGATAEARTDAAGLFTLRGVGEGPQTLTASGPPELVPPGPLTVESGAEGVELVLARGLSARVRVLDPAGLPVTGAYVNLSPSPPPGLGAAEQRALRQRLNGREQPSASTGPDGAVSFRGLDPQAAYTLYVQPPQGRHDVKMLHLPAWTPGDQDVRLEAGGTVAGVVRDPQGKPIAGAMVFYRLGESGWSGQGTQHDGSFRLTGLAPGTVSLRPRPGSSLHGSWDAEGPEVTVAVGSENVALVIERGLSLVVRVAGADEPRSRREGRQAILLTPAGGGGWQQAGWAHAQGGEALTFTGVKAGERYAVWIPPTAGSDLYGWAENLLGGGEHTVTLTRGATIRGRLEAPQGATNLGVSAYRGNGQSVQGTLDAEGRYEIRGLPEGTWSVTAQGHHDGQGLHVQAEAAAGATLDLRLEPRRR